MYRYALMAAGVALAAVALLHSPAKPPAATVSARTPAAPASSPSWGRARRRAPAAFESMVVYVAGAVPRPGLYRLRAGSRVDDAVRMAGGLERNADAAGVNLAQRLEDGDEVEVPVVGETPHLRSRHPSHRRLKRSRRSVGVVELNAAGADSLAGVPGIGAAIAQRIVEVRDREGPFASLDELLDVAGMTAGRLERARPHLRL